MPALKVEHVRKIYPSMHAKGQEVLAIDDISLEVRRMSFAQSWAIVAAERQHFSI